MKYYKVKKENGTKVEMDYDDVCRDLEFDPDVRFIKITTAGTISFWAGKPNEIIRLWNAVVEKGYIPSSALKYCVEHKGWR